MKKEVVAAVLALIVVLAAGSVILVEYRQTGTSTSTRPTTGVSTVPQNCTTVFPPAGLPLTEPGNQTRLFAVLPGETGLLCVTYSVDSSEIAGANFTAVFRGTVEIVKSTYTSNPGQEGQVYSYSSAPAPGITDYATPYEVNIQKAINTTTLTIVYSIAVSQNASGFYSVGFTLGCPTLIPLAVTTDWTSVTTSDFPGFFVQTACPREPILSDARVTGIANMNTTLLVGQTASTSG